MFGGYGLYKNKVIFGMIVEDKLYFKGHRIVNSLSVIIEFFNCCSEPLIFDL